MEPKRDSGFQRDLMRAADGLKRAELVGSLLSFLAGYAALAAFALSLCTAVLCACLPFYLAGNQTDGTQASDSTFAPLVGLGMALIVSLIALTALRVAN